MGQFTSNSASNEVAWQVVARVFGDGQARAFSFEEGLEIWHPAMVDVFICAAKAPVFGIGGEVFLHILMDELLEIEAERPVSADNFVCADARFGGHIPSRIGQRNVGWLISDGVSGAVQGRMGEPGGKGFSLGYSQARIVGQIGLGKTCHKKGNQNRKHR